MLRLVPPSHEVDDEESVDVAELLLEHLKSIQGQLRALTDDVGDIKVDMRGLETHMAGFMQSEVAQDGNLVAIRLRLDRIEKRLGLVDPPDH